MKLEYFLQIFEKFPNIKFYEIGLVGFLLFHVEREGQADEQTYTEADMTKHIISPCRKINECA
jgi:hypothetical protein